MDREKMATSGIYDADDDDDETHNDDAHVMK